MRSNVRRQAEREGQSLSRWLQEHGLEGLDERNAKKKLATGAELEKFFVECDRRENGRGQEPDWEDHLRVIDASQSGG